MAAFSLKAMFAAVHEAIVTASQDVEGGIWDTLQERYFDKNEDGTYKPKSIVLNLPHTEHGKLTETTVEVPLFSLSMHNSLAVDELKVNFEVDLRGLKNDDLVGSLPRRFLTRKSQAQVEIKFKGADASEGVMLINDKIHQTFPR